MKIPDLNSGLRAFRREVSLPYLRLLPPRFSCVTTITVAFLANQHEVLYVPVGLGLLAAGFAKAVHDVAAHPFRIATDTVLLFMTGLLIASLALLADLIVRSRSAG